MNEFAKNNYDRQQFKNNARDLATTGLDDFYGENFEAKQEIIDFIETGKGIDFQINRMPYSEQVSILGDLFSQLLTDNSSLSREKTLDLFDRIPIASDIIVKNRNLQSLFKRWLFAIFDDAVDGWRGIDDELFHRLNANFFFLSFLDKDKFSLSDKELSLNFFQNYSFFIKNTDELLIELSITNSDMEIIARSLNFFSEDSYMRFIKEDPVLNDFEHSLERLFESYFVVKREKILEYIVEYTRLHFFTYATDASEGDEEFEDYLNYITTFTDLEKMKLFAKTFAAHMNIDDADDFFLNNKDSFLLKNINREKLRLELEKELLKEHLTWNDSEYRLRMFEEYLNGDRQSAISDEVHERELKKLLPKNMDSDDFDNLERYVHRTYDLREYLYKLRNFDFKKEIIPILRSQGDSAYFSIRELNNLPNIEYLDDEEKSFIVWLFQKKKLETSNILRLLLSELHSLREFIPALKSFLEEDIISFELFMEYIRTPKEEQAEVFSEVRVLVGKIVDGTITENELLGPFGATALFTVFPPQSNVTDIEYAKLVAKRKSIRNPLFEKYFFDLQYSKMRINQRKVYLPSDVKVDLSLWTDMAVVVQRIQKQDVRTLSRADDFKSLLAIIQKKDFNFTEVIEIIYKQYLASGGDQLSSSYYSKPSSLNIYLEFLRTGAKQSVFSNLIKDYKEEYSEEYEKLKKSLINNFKRGYLPKLINLVKIARKHERNQTQLSSDYTTTLALIQDHLTIVGLSFNDIKDKKMSELSQMSFDSFTIDEDKFVEELVADKITRPIYSKMQAEVDKFQSVDTTDTLGKRQLNFLITKEREHAVAGYNMGVCVVKDTKLWNNENFYNVVILDPEIDKAFGGFHILVHNDSLILPGINPTESLLETVSPADLYKKIILFSKIIARRLKLARVLIPSNQDIFSNRNEIQKIIISENYETTQLPEKINFSYAPSYKMHDCFVVT